VVYPVPTNEAITTESQRYNCFVRNGGNSIPQQACPEAKGSNSSTGLNLRWARNPFTGEILTTGKFHKKKAEGFSPNDDHICVSTVMSLMWCCLFTVHGLLDGALTPKMVEHQAWMYFDYHDGTLTFTMVLNQLKWHPSLTIVLNS